MGNPPNPMLRAQVLSSTFSAPSNLTDATRAFALSMTRRGALLDKTALWLPNDLIVNVPVPLRHGWKRSGLLDKLDPKKELISLAAKTGFREITIGKGASKYEAVSNTLVLSPEGALAAAAFSHAVPNASPSAEILKNYISMRPFPSNASPERIAATLFFAHLCTNGILKAADNLYISTNTVTLLRESGLLSRLEQIQEYLYKFQADFLERL